MTLPAVAFTIVLAGRLPTGKYSTIPAIWKERRTKNIPAQRETGLAFMRGKS